MPGFWDILQSNDKRLDDRNDTDKFLMQRWALNISNRWLNIEIHLYRILFESTVKQALLVKLSTVRCIVWHRFNSNNVISNWRVHDSCSWVGAKNQALFAAVCRCSVHIRDLWTPVTLCVVVVICWWQVCRPQSVYFCSKLFFYSAKLLRQQFNSFTDNRIACELLSNSDELKLSLDQRHSSRIWNQSSNGYRLKQQ